MNKPDPIVSVLKRFRERKQQTQEQLAKMTGISTRTIQRLESGKTDMKLGQYRLIINALEISDMDVSIALMTHEFVSDKDVAAVSRRLPFNIRLVVVRFLNELAEALKK